MGSYRDAGAFDFTARVIGIASGFVGVQGIEVADFDDDGDDDVMAVGSRGVVIYNNEGDYNFIQDLKDDKRAERLQLVDIDKDGDTDALITFPGSPVAVRWYENTGGMNFTAHSLGTTGDDPVAYAGDLDGDGAVDIVTAGQEGGLITLRRWMNDGNQLFTSTTMATNTGISALAIVDRNANGFPDIIAGGTAGLQYWDTGDGVTWARADIDDANDNRTDISAATTATGGTWLATADYTANIVALYRSSSYGRLVVATEVDAKVVKIIDIEGDGDLDLLVTAQDDNKIFLYQNDGTDNFSENTLASGLQSVYGVATGDFDNDGDLDFVTGDHMQGTVFVYERHRTKPEATTPDTITQATAGTGLVTFATTVSDGDGDPTRLRVQYSFDGNHWYKPWLTKVTADVGTVDLTNSNGYQVGTANPIDTDTNDSVSLTFTWDTKSMENTGGPILGDMDTLQLRVIARDDKNIGVTKITGKFTVDNASPQGLSGLAVDSVAATEATLTWNKPTDGSAYSYVIYYGTDHSEVVEKKSNVWGVEEDAALADVGTEITTITGLSTGKRYAFKIFATDAFGNEAAISSVQALVEETTTAEITPEPSSTVAESPDPTSLPEGAATPEPTTSPITEPTSTLIATATPTVTPVPVIQANAPPIADAGPDSVVNARALVILDGAASFDPDPGDTVDLRYQWRQLSGPVVDVLSERTATPSFTVGDANEVYIFSLTVGDSKGATAIDTVTLATKDLTPIAPASVAVAPVAAVSEPTSNRGGILFAHAARLVDYGLFGLAVLSIFLLMIDRIIQRLQYSRRARSGVAGGAGSLQSYSRVVHYLTGNPIAGAQVLIYGKDKKLRAQKRTNDRGVFEASFPPGEYTIAVPVHGFSFAPPNSGSFSATDGIIYGGGTITVKDASKPPTIIIPLKPVAIEVTSFRVRVLKYWQAVLQLSRTIAWPLLMGGAMVNTLLIFFAPSAVHLVLEILYVVLVVVKIATEVRVRPAYGQVRDAITHIPLDLAVVRLYEQKTNRLMMTRVANSQGKFFALPPTGTYIVTVSKPGYATFTKEDVVIESDRDTTLQMTADLMPVTPQAMGGLMRARGATI